jgi:hypothetical protein
VQNAGFSQYYRGAAACKDKWQGLFGEYKKIKDYNDATGCNEDYFRMGSKRRKELCLPANFCSSHYKEMDRFLHQRPCLNPPYQRDSLDDEAPQPMTAEELHEYCIQNGVDPLTVGGQNNDVDPVLHHSPASLASSGSGSHRQHDGTPKATCKGHEKLDLAAKNTMKPDPHPANTGIKRRHSSSQTRLVEITETQGKEIVSSMRTLSEVEVQKVTAAEVIANKQLEYFKLHDKEIASTQRGLVDAVTNLSNVLGLAVSNQQHASGHRRAPTPYNFRRSPKDNEDSSDGVRLHLARYRSPGQDTTSQKAKDTMDTEEEYAASLLQNLPVHPGMSTGPQGGDVHNSGGPTVDISDYYVDVDGDQLC